MNGYAEGENSNY